MVLGSPAARAEGLAPVAVPAEAVAGDTLKARMVVDEATGAPLGFLYPLDLTAVVEARLKQCRACEAAPDPVPCPEAEPLPIPALAFPGGWKAGLAVGVGIVAVGFAAGFAAGR